MKNYFSQITLANGRKFQAASDKSLLDCAKEQDLILEYSCKSGRCGVCRVKADAKKTVALQPETGLSAQEAESGYILTCCRAAIADLTLDTEDLGILAQVQAKVLPCRIDHLELLKGDVMQVILRTPPANKLEYLAGQYINISGPDNVTRSYSLANAPRVDGKLILQVRCVPDGEMSRYWFEKAKPNDLLRLHGPFGTFCMRKTTAYIVFMATGTGIAPVQAMLQQMLSNGAPMENVHVYWGGRTAEDIYWEPAESDFPGLNFIPVLSRPNSDWKGRAGYIQNAVLQDDIPLHDTVVYACGSEAMIDSASRALINAGLSAKNFHSDAFVSSSK